LIITISTPNWEHSQNICIHTNEVLFELSLRQCCSTRARSRDHILSVSVLYRCWMHFYSVLTRSWMVMTQNLLPRPAIISFHSVR
jgi:hypothetical protein